MFTAADFDISKIELPPARKINREGQARHLYNADLVKIFNELPSDKWRCVFAIAYFTGARISEVLKLRVEDIHDGRINYVKASTKKRKNRQVKIVPQLQPFLDAYESPVEGYLFPAHHNTGRQGMATKPNAGHLSRPAADQVLRRVTSQLDLDGTSTHSFRRSFATNLHLAGTPTAQIKRLLGHASIDQTAQYIG